MKATIEKFNVKSDIPFPKLMRSSVSGVIVLFKTEGSGMVVSGTGLYHIGYYSTDWGMDYFTDLNGTVTLQND